MVKYRKQQLEDRKMDRAKWFRKMLSVTLVCALVLGGCSAKEDSSGTEQQDVGQSGQKTAPNGGDIANGALDAAGQRGTSDIMEDLPEIDITFTDRDMDASYDESTAASVEFQEGEVDIQGEGGRTEGTTVTISQEGTYVLRGSCADGQIIVDAGENDKIQLVLDGLQLGCTNFAPLYIRQADKVVLTLAEGSENALWDGEDYEAAQAAKQDANVDGVISSRADLTVNGSGSLTVTGLYKHGIVSKDDLTVTGGQVTVKAVGGGMYGKDCVKIADGIIRVDSGKDAIQSDNSENKDRGYVYIAGGSLVLNAGGDGIQAETVLQVDGGELHVQAGGDCEAAANTQIQSEDGASDSAKGLKAGGGLLIKGGSIEIDSADDALHSNGAVGVWDGVLQLSTGDDGLHADGAAAIYGGEIQILTSHEGIEGSTVEIGGGNIWLTASDDGINAAGGSDGMEDKDGDFGGSDGGNDGSSGNRGDGGKVGDGGVAGTKNGGRFGADQFKDSENSDIHISGGTLYVNASGDGLDANGSLYVSGGTVYVDGPISGGDSALDYDGTGEVSGGTIVAVCSAGMAQGFSDSSSQISILFQFDSPVDAGEGLKLTDSQGNVLISHTPEKSYQVAAVSSPQLEEGGTYTLTAGEQEVEITITGKTNGNISGRGMPGGGRPGRAPGVPGEAPGQGAPDSQEKPGRPDREGDARPTE